MLLEIETEPLDARMKLVILNAELLGEIGRQDAVRATITNRPGIANPRPPTTYALGVATSTTGALRLRHFLAVVDDYSNRRVTSPKGLPGDERRQMPPTGRAPRAMDTRWSRNLNPLVRKEMLFE